MQFLIFVKFFLCDLSHFHPLPIIIRLMYMSYFNIKKIGILSGLDVKNLPFQICPFYLDCYNIFVMQMFLRLI